MTRSVRAAGPGVAHVGVAAGVGAAVLLLLGCPGQPKAVVYDLVARMAVAETWSATDVLLFGTPAAEPRLVEHAMLRASAAAALVLDMVDFGFPGSQAIDAALQAGRIA